MQYGILGNKPNSEKKPGNSNDYVDSCSYCYSARAGFGCTLHQLSVTTTVPTMPGCGLQKYGYSPALSKVKLNDCPFPIIPESKTPSFEVTVCLPESSFIHVTVSPTLTSTGFGLNELLPALATILTTVELLGMDAVGCCMEFPDPPTPIFMLPDRTYVATIAPAITTDAITMPIFLTMARVIWVFVLTLVYLSYVV